MLIISIAKYAFLFVKFHILLYFISLIIKNTKFDCKIKKMYHTCIYKYILYNIFEKLYYTNINIHTYIYKYILYYYTNINFLIRLLSDLIWESNIRLKSINHIKDQKFVNNFSSNKLLILKSFYF